MKGLKPNDIRLTTECVRGVHDRVHPCGLRFKAGTKFKVLEVHPYLIVAEEICFTQYNYNRWNFDPTFFEKYTALTTE